MSKRVSFEKLPVGSCFAFEAGTKQATRRKVDAGHTMTLPQGRKTYRVEDVEMPVFVKECPVSFGRRRKRRANTKKGRR